MKNYQIVSGRFFRHQYECPIPENLKEITEQQFICFAGIIDTDDYFEKFLLLRKVLNLPKRVFKKFYFDEISSFLDELDTIKLQTFRWIPKEIKIGRRRLSGPSDGFETMSFAEFAAADAAYLKFCDTRNDFYLNRLAAILYRFKKECDELSPEYSGENKQPYNEFAIDGYMKLIEKADICFKKAVLLNYSMIREVIEKMYPYVFPKSTSEIIVANKKKPADHSASWLNVMLNIAEKATEYDNVAKQNLHIILHDLNNKIKEDKKNERK